MTLKLDDFNLMEFLWEIADKSHEGRYINYTKNQVIFLWHLGVVDTDNISLEKWISILKPYEQLDGTFLFNKDSFLSLDKYRYKGEIRVPFDPMKINEGKYTQAGLQDLIDLSISPSCALSPDNLKKFFDEFKQKFKTKDDLIEIRRPAKLLINELLKKYPSPLHNLELLFDQMLKGNKFDVQTQAQTIEDALNQKSTFEKITEEKIDKGIKLKNLEKSIAQTKKVETKEELTLQQIKRSKKGIRG